MVRRVTRLAGPALREVFVLRTEFERKRAGSWRRELEPTFPGYVFLDVVDEQAFAAALGLASAHARLVRVGEAAAPLSCEEAAILLSLSDAGRVIRSSEGCLVGERLVAWRGPLAGREDLVHHIDRHRSRAYLSTGFSGRRLVVGLAVVARLSEGSDVDAFLAMRMAERAVGEVSGVTVGSFS